MPSTEKFRFDHQSPDRIGILVTNLGTPDSYRVKDVRKYLEEFLWDHRVVEVPRPIWWLVLNLVILNTRPRKSAKAYESVWTDRGSPLLSITMDQADALRETLTRENASIEIEMAMRYGSPSIEKGLDSLRKKGASKILILPLYPQYSATTTASTFDAVGAVISQWRWIPELRFINHYHDHPDYIAALAQSVREHWDQHGRADKLLMSFHGIPQDYFEAGDPYHCECQKTGRLLAESLGLEKGEWMLTFQSRLGPKQWLKPYTDHTLEVLAQEGINSIQVICPGFSADCLETLEEIAVENRDIFLEAGGKRYEYIPCLNDRADHIAMLQRLIETHIQGWSVNVDEETRNASKARAIEMGASS